MSTQTKRERVLAPLTNTTKGHWILLVLFSLGTLWLVIAWYFQLTEGLFETTGLGDWGTSEAVPWGMYIGAFVWWVGIAHGGIAISAAVRVFRLERFKPIARIAEVLTVLALAMAAGSIVFSLARPDRVFNTIVQWPLTVHHSPLAWDIAVITLYLVLSLTYITLTLRPDLAAVRDRVPVWLSPIYAFVLIGYTEGEEEKINQMVWWLAVTILALVPLLSGGVVPWLFGLIGAQPGWYGAAAGPSMLVESLASAMAVVIIVAAAFRYAYGWEDMIGDQIFWDLGKVLALLVIATLWFVVHDILTGIYLGPSHIDTLTETILALPFFWLAMVGLIGAAMYLIVGFLRSKYLTIPGLVITSAVVTVMILNKKVMFVVEGLMHPTVPPLANLYPTGVYSPTWVEWSLVIGSVMAAGLGYVVISKVIPMIELDDLDTDEGGMDTEHESAAGSDHGPPEEGIDSAVETDGMGAVDPASADGETESVSGETEVTDDGDSTGFDTEVNN